MDNQILCEITIKKEDINKPIQLLNYLDNEKKHLCGKENLKEIKDNCELYLNGEKIDFTFTYKFQKEGKNKLKIVCKKPLSNIGHMFYDCTHTNFIDLSHFNSSNLVELNGLFYNCTLLSILLLGNLNTSNVKSMINMFRDCSSLTELDVTCLNTSGVV